MGTILIVGIAVAFNFAILKWKYDTGRHTDLVLDVIVLVILSYLFNGTAAGLGAAMVGGAIVSIYLTFSTKHTNTSKTASKPSKDSGIVW